MILILAHLYSNRLSFVVEQLAHANWQTPVRLTFLESDWLAYAGPKLAYLPPKQLSDLLNRYPGTLGIPASPFIYNNSYTPEAFDTIRWNGITVPFAMPFAHEKAIPFDVFSSVFYLLSRYEEYQPLRTDAFGRTPSSACFMVKTQQEHTPIIDIIADRLYLMLTHVFKLPLLKPQFRGLPTYDIDIAYAFKARSAALNLGHIAKSALSLQFNQLKNRLSTQFGAQDPFDSYAYINALNKQKRSIMFFLCRREGKHDRSIPPKSKAMRKLVQNQAEQFEIGFHPSLLSHNQFSFLEEERSTLDAHNQSSIYSSRQHYIKIQYPETFRNLVTLGIKRDYSIGFTDRLGFKAGTAHPFLFYDVERDAVGQLLLHPFVAMDTVYIQHLKWSPEQTLEQLLPLIDHIRKRGGLAQVIFHNSLLTDYQGLGKWKSVHETLLHALQ